jgi:uncharacterized integral membrane protein
MVRFDSYFERHEQSWSQLATLVLLAVLFFMFAASGAESTLYVGTHFEITNNTYCGRSVASIAHGDYWKQYCHYCHCETISKVSTVHAKAAHCFVSAAKLADVRLDILHRVTPLNGIIVGSVGAMTAAIVRILKLAGQYEYTGVFFVFLRFA